MGIGIHAVFGGFVVGVTVGDVAPLRSGRAIVIHDFVTNVFAPVFFASLGLRADFIASFDLRLCALVFAIATRREGHRVHARVAGRRPAWRPSAAVGFGLNARGAMEIILALLALEAGLMKTRCSSRSSSWRSSRRSSAVRR